jgi:hypothetical protein
VAIKMLLYRPDAAESTAAEAVLLRVFASSWPLMLLIVLMPLRARPRSRELEWAPLERIEALLRAEWTSPMRRFQIAWST